MLFIINGAKMPTTDGRRQSFPPALLPLLLLVLLSGCPPPCKGDLKNSAGPSLAPTPAPTLALDLAPAPSLGFETVGFNISRALCTGHVHGRITPKRTSGGQPSRQPGSRTSGPKRPCDSPPCTPPPRTGAAGINVNRA
ncbi:hypothetical protein GQ55_8G234000 [Panicum hallii var. hallii]|uniref:Uncharacterized protein n=1 Tax=Panicum hallii var. hallii TaxID=1504633 RepID=A0A2T7CQD1_9POAL|nr:hypothetical protein GQ55_8G234000 [Panicum hallii var. hallii]